MYSLSTRYSCAEHNISAQNEGKHVLATSIFQNFLGEGSMPPDLWRTIGAKIQLLNFACTFGIRYCSFTICTYICNSTFKFPISLLQLTVWHCLFHNSTSKFTQFNIQVCNSTSKFTIQHPSLRTIQHPSLRKLWKISNRNPVNDSQCGLRKLSKFSLCRG